MKELISIYVSLFLVFSPLFGQTKQEANMHMTNGDVVKVTIINVSKEFIKVEMINKDGKIIKPNIPKSMIYQILSPDGKLLYPNLDAEDELKWMAEENRRIIQKKEDERKQLEEENRIAEQSEQLMTQGEYERKAKWNIVLTGESSFLNVALWNIKGDSLVVIDMGISRAIYIGSIANISALKGKSNAGKGAKIGFITGAVIGVTWVGLYYADCDGSQPTFDGCSNKDVDIGGGFKFAAVVAGILGIPFALLGGIIGGFFKYVEEYDMSNWSIEEKRVQIRKIMNKKNE